MKAGLWSEAHQLLMLQVAPRLLIASHHPSDALPTQEQQQLESELQQLLSNVWPHADDIQQRSEGVNSGLLAWDAGAELYAEYYDLRV